MLFFFFAGGRARAYPLPPQEYTILLFLLFIYILLDKKKNGIGVKPRGMEG